MAVSHKSVISFGLVAIPIAMYTATQDNEAAAVQILDREPPMLIKQPVA